MKRFKYRLESLLKIKSHIEKEKQKVHAAAVKKVQDQNQHLCEVDRDRLDTVACQRRSQAVAISLSKLLICSRYLMKLKKDTLAGAELLHAMKKDTEEKRQDLVEASKERKIYEKLKEKQMVRYSELVKDLEKKESDEIANTNFLRNTRI